MKKLILSILMIAIIGTGCQSGQNADDGNVQDDTDWSGKVVFNGVEYRHRADVKNILFLGVDNTRLSDFGEGVIGNNGRADAIMMFIVDTKTKTTQLLTISRDTMTEVDVYDGLGDLRYSGIMQLNLQYVYGNSARRSCFLTKRTVSELLYDARIDGYFSLTMDGIPVIVEKLGGITITMPEDYTYIDSRYTEGAVITMDGDEAERFVRYRDINEFGSNEVRNMRQTWFVTEMFKQMRGRDDLEETVEDVLDAAEDYIETDTDAETLKLLATSEITETYKVPGEVRQGEFHNEFYVDEEGLKELVIQLFYRPAE